MSNSIKEVLFKFVFVVLAFSIIGHFVKGLNITIIKSVAISSGIAIVDLIAYIIRIYKDSKTC
ncbi:hypothetical protein [Clostridium oceanicum]|uniref:Uncharacterized protein n=1 Tax=Clostridium oceanicum TaxID=1543 RepID=A0ABP3UTN4_9CLOT